MESILSEQVVLSPQGPYPFKVILSPTELSRVGVPNTTRGLSLLLEGGWPSCSLTFKGIVPGNSKHASRVSVWEGTHWLQTCAGSKAFFTGTFLYI